MRYYFTTNIANLTNKLRTSIIKTPSFFAFSSSVSSSSYSNVTSSSCNIHNNNDNNINDNILQKTQRRYYTNTKKILIGSNNNIKNKNWKNKKKRKYKKKYFDDESKFDLSSITIENNTNNERTTSSNDLTIAIEGCCHGKLNTIYSVLQQHEIKTSTKIDLLIICGDFQSIRSPIDLSSMAVPNKYKTLGDFYEYYSGRKKAPILTIFVGGNHENYNQLSELYYGGWVCPNIYYLGYANVINFHGLRIASISGIYNNNDTIYNSKRIEYPPFLKNSKTKKSIYHIRKDAIYQLSCLTNPIDIMISHDWPSSVLNHGNLSKLMRIKPHFKHDIKHNLLCNPKLNVLLHDIIQPQYWFSAHLHVDYEAAIPHNVDNNEVTYFRALDKVIPKRKFIRIASFASSSSSNKSSASFLSETNKENNSKDNNYEQKKVLRYDIEWLSILKKTHSYFSQLQDYTLLEKEYPILSITDEDRLGIQKLFDNNLIIPDNFQHTIDPFYEDKVTSATGNSNNNKNGRNNDQYVRIGDPQTDLFLKTLKLDHVITIPYNNPNMIVD